MSGWNANFYQFFFFIGMLILQVNSSVTYANASKGEIHKFYCLNGTAPTSDIKTVIYWHLWMCSCSCLLHLLFQDFLRTEASIFLGVCFLWSMWLVFVFNVHHTSSRRQTFLLELCKNWYLYVLFARILLPVFNSCRCHHSCY